MANTISLMSNVIRNVVSKKRIRYKEKGYNLDLTYIDERIIAMGYPAPDRIEGIYRNRYEDVYKFLEENHGQHYKIYNLCLERSYDSSKFNGRVGIYPFEDHNPPTIELIQRFCKDVDLWLKENDANVVAVHCKAGKGRTGTMICAYLLYSGLKKSADEALAWYDEKRTKDRKGVTIPSQRRYVQYFSKLVCSSVPYSKISLNVCEIRFSESSFLQNLGTVQFSVYVLTDSATENVKLEKLKTWSIDFQKSFVLTSSPALAVAGDLKFELAQNSSKKICHFWLNTFFVQNSSNCESDGTVNKYTHTLSKSEIDDVHKDREHKSFSEDFKISIIFEAENYCNDVVQVVQAEPSELEKNDNVLNFERSDYDGLTANCFPKKKVLSAIVNDTMNNTSKSQTIEPLLDHKDHNIVTKIQYDTSTNSKNTSSTASKRKQPNNSKPLSSSLNDSNTREDIKKNHMYNNQPSIKKTDLITWQNSEVHITSSDTRSINENKNINYNSYITCNQSSNPKFSCGTEEGEEDWESGESTYL